jgi:hypothetical protein
MGEPRSYGHISPPCLNYLQQVGGFSCWPRAGLVKDPYPPAVERLRAAKATYRAWRATPEGVGCTYDMPETSEEEEEEEDEVERIMEARIVGGWGKREGKKEYRVRWVGCG